MRYFVHKSGGTIQIPKVPRNHFKDVEKLIAEFDLKEVGWAEYLYNSIRQYFPSKVVHREREEHDIMCFHRKYWDSTWPFRSVI